MRRSISQKMFSRIGNPLDMGIFGGMRRSAEVPSLLMGDAGVSVGLALVHSMNPWQGDPYRAAMAQGAGDFEEAAAGGDAGRACRRRNGRPILARGIDVFTDTDILLEGIGALMTAPPEPMPDEVRVAAPPLPGRPLTEPESLRLLATYGVRTVPTVEVRVRRTTAVAAADAAGLSGGAERRRRGGGA